MDDAQTDHLKAYGLTFRLLERGGRAEWFLNYRSGVVPAAGRRRHRRGTRRSTGSRSSRSTTASWCRSAASSQGGNMDAVPLEKAPKVAVYAPPNARAVGRRGDHGAQLRRHRVREGLGPRGAGQQAQDLRLAAPAPRGLHRPVLQVLPELRRRALAGGHGRAEPGHGAAARVSRRCPAEKRAVAVAIARVRRAGRIPVRHVHRHRDARPGAGGRRRGHRGVLRRRHADGSRTPSRQDAMGAGARLPERRSWS